MGVAAATAFVEHVLTPMGVADIEARTVPAAYKINPRPVEPSVVATEAEIRTTNPPVGEKRRQSLYVAHGYENDEVR